MIIQLGFLIFFTSLIDPNYGKDSRVRFKNEYTETQRLKNILHGMQKLLTLVHRKANVGNSREESCDIETALLFLKNNNVSETVFTNTFEGIKVQRHCTLYCISINVKIFREKKTAHRNHHLISSMQVFNY